MAEPLLKRTFSRLRSRRKTDPKVNDVPVQTSSPPSSPVGPEPPSPPRNHITVAKKQQWARQGAAAPPTYLCMSSSHRPHNKEVPAVTTHDVHGNTRRQSPRQDQVDSCSDRTVTCLSWDRSSAPCVVAASTTLQDTSQPAGGATDISASNTGKRSGQRSYLQSLERSSRAWVLSSGKTQVSEDQVCPLEDTGGNIWYNPIPEEEDSSVASSSTTVTTTATLHREVEDEVWRRRIDPEDTTSVTEGAGNSRAESGGPWLRSAEVRGNICPPEGANPNVRHQFDDITTESAEPTSLDSSPVTQKKASVSASVMDRLRSPGTVRKLSMKMKKLPELRRKLSLRSSRSQRQGSESRGGGDEWANKSVTSSSNQNVISKYHLDSSAPPARPLRRSSRGRSAGRGGHLSDGDSPELLPRQQAPPSPPQPMSSQELGCDTSSFRLYLGSEPQRCSQRVSGLLTIHLLGLEEMKSCRVDDSKEVFLAIQVDGVTRARTSLLNLRSCALPLNHTFHLELERARKLRIVVLTPANAHTVGGSKATGQSDRSDGPTRNRVCCLGGVSIPPLFKGSRSQQLCVKLEPQGLLYVKLSLQEKWETQNNNDPSIPANVFGVELHHLVEKEGSAVPIPLLIQKAVAEIEQRGLKVVGLYRLCGSAAVKKELRDWFERNSSAVCLSEDLYPDINVITGILKDYLRELPSPLITTNLYQVVRDAMTLHPLTADPQRTVELLSCLPPPERATLSLLLDHLSLVASFSSFNRMTQQNLAVCFGPVLLTPTQEAWQHGMGGVRGGRGGNKGLAHNQEMASAVDFKRHIEALHYLLQQWPVPKRQFSEEEQASPPPSPLITHNAVQRTQLPSLHLSLPQSEETVVSRRGRSGLGRLDSPPPINRYAGDWSVCGQDILSGQEADYDEVAGSESDEDSDEEEEPKKEVWPPGGSTALYVEDFLDFDAPFNCRLSLKDFDNLIHDLDRELAKHINICL